MDIKALVKISSRAWSLNILALLHDGTPGRQAPMLAATSAGRTAFQASLQHLIELNLVERNPGHGHPLRPEFRLTKAGKRAAVWAAVLVKTVPDDNQFSLLRRSWSLPILSVTYRPRFFSEIRRELMPITDRALSQSLHRLEDHGWIRREVNLNHRPLRPQYIAQGQGMKIACVAPASGSATQ